MPMSDYIRDLRARIGNTVLEVPTVSVIVFDEAERVLLVRHIEGNDWTTPGGMIEPYEIPADAALRETWEETGLHVELTHIIAVLGGKPWSTAYANGDKVAWVSTVFGARILSGTPRPDNEETLETRFVARAEIAALRCKPHLPLVLEAAYSRNPRAAFQPPTWTPTT
jgi:8-oxo-dGTP pyrophosphatase MutT (NUDIX family)